MWPYLVNVKPEWLKLYLCRLSWLYRNTGYTFAYEVCGMNIDDSWVVANDTTASNGYYLAYETSKPWYSRGWCLKAAYKWCEQFHLDVYLGWKYRTMRINGRTMIAMRINPLRGN